MNTPRPVHLFLPCLIREAAPDTGRAAIALLRALGCGPVVPAGQTCCGQILAKQGHGHRLLPAARLFLRLFQGADAVVVPSASCAAQIRNYPDLFPPRSPEHRAALDLAGRVRELSQFIVDDLGRVDLGAVFQARAVYHASCQAERVHGLARQPRALLAAVRGLDLCEPSGGPACCGFGGGFSLGHPEVSLAILEEKAAALLATGAEVAVGLEPGCLLHMDGYFRKQGLPLRTLHLAEVLARGLGWDPTERA